MQAQWTSGFQITRADLEFLFSQFLDDETPRTASELAQSLIAHRISQQRDQLRKQVERGELFQPRASYKVGQKIVFPAFDFSVGKVVSQRAGNNPDYGDFTVIEVEFEDKQRREFASRLSAPHVLNIDGDGGRLYDMPDVAAVWAEYGEEIAEKLEARLVDEKDTIFFNGRWFLRSLLANVNVGHLNLAEAILDINEGGPCSPSALLNDVGLPKEVPPRLQEFSLNVAMSDDERFDNVAPTGQILWFLRRLEPAEIQKIPPRLVYQPLDYDRSLLTEDLIELERELDDELSDLEAPAAQPAEITLTVIYPHRRVGTLPLGSRLASMLPSAEETPRMRLTLVDAQAGTEFAGSRSSAAVELPRPPS